MFYRQDIAKQSDKSLVSGVKSYKKQIAEHEYKIEHPDKFYIDWDDVNETVRKGRLKHWRKEITNFEQSIQDNLQELERRKKYEKH